MTKQPTKPSQELLDKLKGVDDDTLEGRVESAEGINGSSIEPVYSTRKMRCYTITESELQQINLANIGVTAIASIGTAFLAFWLDVFKDTLLADNVPDSAQVIINYVQPILLFLGLAFWGFAIAVLWWRRGLIKTIKEESTNT